jgi:hypothetical protein
MAIRYTTTRFVKPSRISRNEYEQLKSKLSADPNYNFEPYHPSMTESYRKIGNSILLSLIGSVFLMVVGGYLFDGSNFLIVFMLPGVLLLMYGVSGGFKLLLEMPSYASFLSTKRSYFSNMREAIIKSNSYEDFVNKFYLK